MNPPRVLIAGIGNIFLGDDAFGVEVARRLLRRPMPDGVRVVDFGIRGVDLYYTLLDGCDTAILVDAVLRGQAPGTLYLIEPEPTDPNAGVPVDIMLQTHSMDPMRVLQLTAAMSDHVKRVLLVGCEPQACGGDEDFFPDGLSEPVLAAVDQAVECIELLIGKILSGDNQPLTLTLPPQPTLLAGGKEIGHVS